MRAFSPLLLCLVLCLSSRLLAAQSVAQQPMRRAAPLDSVARGEKARYEAAMRDLRSQSVASFDTSRQIMTLTVHMRLARLGYAAGPFDVSVTPTLAEAIRRYELDRGLPATGDPLTFELNASLSADEKVFDTAPALPSRFVSVSPDYVYAKGAWTFSEMGDQAIAVELTCRRADRRCVESQAILTPGSWVTHTLSTDQQEWAIERWDAVEIATAPVDFTCAHYVLRIDLVQKTASKVRSTISNASSCAHQSKADLNIALEDGPTLAGQNAREASSSPFPALLSPAASALLNRGTSRTP